MTDHEGANEPRAFEQNALEHKGRVSSWTRTNIRRAFPYLVIAIAGFAVAYVIVFVFVLPSRIVPKKQAPYVRDSLSLPIMGDSDGEIQAAPNVIAAAPPMMAPYAPPPAPIPVEVPDLSGMALSDARGVLNSLQLTATVTYDTSSDQEPNTILRQSPQAGTKVSEHGTIALVAVRPMPMTPPSESTVPQSLPPRQHRPLPPIQPGAPEPQETTPTPVPVPTPTQPAPTPVPLPAPSPLPPSVPTTPVPPSPPQN